MKIQIQLTLCLMIAIGIMSTACANRLSLASAKPAIGNDQTIPTPADAKIKKAKALVKDQPNSANSHLALAAALLQKVRETGDYSINRSAEESIAAAVRLDSKNFEAKFFQTQIYLSEHKFAEALATAEEMMIMRPDSTLVLAAKTDSLTELGRYDEAVKSAQAFVDIRPNSLSYSRVAHLRALHGDTEGALEARRLAIRMGDPQDIETYAWFYSEYGKELFNTGDFVKARLAFEKALEILPEYHWALDGKGKVLAAQGDFKGAASIYEKLRIRVPETSREIFLGDIYARMGRKTDAARIYKEAADRQQSSPNGDLHRIALLWADHDTNLDEALNLARVDRETNNDLLASDTFAWALYKNGQFAAAKIQMDEALRLKSKNAQFFYHLGMIENALGNKKKAKGYLELALKTNPSFDLIQAEVAKRALNQLRN